MPEVFLRGQQPNDARVHVRGIENPTNFQIACSSIEQVDAVGVGPKRYRYLASPSICMPTLLARPLFLTIIRRFRVAARFIDCRCPLDRRIARALFLYRNLPVFVFQRDRSGEGHCPVD